jgi:hypothetical protein
MTDEPRRALPATVFERRVAIAALVAAPALVAVGAVSAAIWPEIMGESDTASLAGALAGVAMVALFVALPQLLFGLALRSGRRGPLNATLIGAPIWAVYVGVLPLAGALVGGWEGLVPLMVLAAAAAAILDVFVVLAARRGLARLRAEPPPPPPVT